MRVFVAGATGAVGKQSVPLLVASVHEVHGMTRHESKRAMLEEMGAVPVVADALDPDDVSQAVGLVQPDVIIHQLTALSGWGMRALKRGGPFRYRTKFPRTGRRSSSLFQGRQDDL